jgi:CSLREA domain-containing protein
VGRPFTLSVALAAVLWLSPKPTFADTFVVNSTLDQPDANTGDGVCATTAGTCTLRAAVQTARAVGGIQVITLPAGTYTMTIPGAGELAGATGDFNVGSAILTINGGGAAVTVIDAAGLDRVFEQREEEGSPGTLTLNDVTVQNGTANGGGCLAVNKLTLARAVVRRCAGGNSGGGAIMAYGSSGSVVLSDTTITQNTGGWGGGLGVSRATLSIVRSTIAGNTADFYGGGISYAGNALTIANTTITGNAASSGGGGIGADNLAPGDIGSMVNATITGNVSRGAVIEVSGSLHVRNTIIANSAPASDQANCLVTLMDDGNNLEFPGTTCGFSLASDRRADPLLGALAYNGGATQTHALGVGSPAIDAGDDATCGAAPVGGVDQRSSSRPFGAHCDMGAHEQSDAPSIWIQPASQTMAPGQTVTMTVVALGSAPLTYQWYVGSRGNITNPIPGATGNGYMPPPLTSTTLYWVRVSNPLGTVDSAAAKISVAGPLVVNSPLDVPVANIDDGICITAAGTCTLRAAIQTARALGGDQVITLPAGTYTITIPGRAEIAGATGDFNIGSVNLTINGAAAATTIVDAAGLDRVFETSSGSGSLTVNDVTIQHGNPGGRGGGCFEIAARLTLTRSVVRECVTGGSGGAIGAHGNTVLIDTTIAQNRAASGGGIFSNSIQMTVIRSTISDNVASVGGGIFHENRLLNLGSTLNIANSTISGNTATTGSGGALETMIIIVEEGVFGVAVSLENTTISGNSSAALGAVVSLLSLNARNTIIANAAGAAPINCASVGGVLTDQGHNLEFPGTTCGFGLASDRRADPLLEALAMNGGLTRTQALRFGSPAIGAADDAACAATPVSGIDQRGLPRPSGVHCDMGAYEFTPRGGRADFDGDGKADLSLYRPLTGYWYIKQSSTDYTTDLARQWGLNTDIPVPGDYDGDGLADVAVYRPSTGYWYILQSSTQFTTYIERQWGLGTDIPVPDDYDGDGKTDLAVYRPSVGYWYVLQSSTHQTTYLARQWGLSGDVPVPADYDGDGKADFAVFRPHDSGPEDPGYWYVLLSSTQNATFIERQWGLATDMPVPGDYDGDGLADVAVYRPATGYWYILQSSTQFTTYIERQWGLSDDIPVPSDYDNDGNADLGLYRPSTGHWYVLLSSTNHTTYLDEVWGVATDIPLLERP